MRDSRIGTFGVIALIGGLGLKTALLAQIIATAGALAAACCLVASEATSRLAALIPLYRLPPARSDGLAQSAGQPSSSAMAQGAIVALTIALLTVGPTAGLLSAVIGLVVCALGGLAVTRLADHMLGGQTGDIAGAAQQISLVGMLAAIAATLTP